jgi:hypothetical protein
LAIGIAEVVAEQLRQLFYTQFLAMKPNLGSLIQMDPSQMDSSQMDSSQMDSSQNGSSRSD